LSLLVSLWHFCGLRRLLEGGVQLRKLQGAQGRGRRKPRRNIPSATEGSGIVAGQPDRIGSEIDARLFQTLISDSRM